MGVRHDRPNSVRRNDPRHHTQKIKQMLNDAASHAREDVEKISDPNAQTLLGTTAEVL